MDLPKFHPNERVDLGDVEFISDGQLGEHQRLLSNLIVGDATKRVIDGFGFTIASATALSIAFGKAVFAENRLATVRYGQLVGGGLPLEGVATQNVSFSGLAAAPYGVYVRFVYGDGTLGNRAFWDTTAALEEIQAVPTRKVAGWQSLVAAASPGDEWSKLCDVVWNAADLNTSTITDARVFMFEGPANSSPQTFRPTWGAGNDRNAARATYGVKTLERFASAVLKKLEELQSDTAATRWWTAPVEPLDKKVSRYGDLTLTGNYQITGGLTTTGEVSANGGVTVGTSLSLEASVDVVPSGASNIGTAGQRLTTLFTKRWDVADASPVLDVEDTSGATAAKIHFFKTGFEGTQFFDVGYEAGAGIARYTTGGGGTALGKHLWTVSGVGVMSIDGTNLVVSVADAQFTGNAAVLGALNVTGIATVGGLIASDVRSDLVPNVNARDLGAAAGNRWDLFAVTIDASGAITAGGAILAGTDGNDIGAVAGNRFDIYGKVGNFSGPLTTTAIVPTAGGENIGTSDTGAGKYGTVHTTELRASGGLVLGAGTVNAISLTTVATDVLDVGGKVRARGGSQDYIGALQADNDFVGAVGVQDPSGIPGAGSTDVGVMMTFRSTQARIGAPVNTYDAPLHIKNHVGLATGQVGSIKVQLTDSGTNQVRGWVRVWATPTG